MSQQTNSRLLGAFERYSLARNRVGIPPVLAFLATLPDDQSISTAVADIRAACQILKDRYPLLCCIVANARTRFPEFRMLGQLKDEELEAIISEQIWEGLDNNTILDQLLERGREINVETGPLWKVVVSKRTPHSGPPKLALVLSHILSDGVGANVLFQQLLQLLAGGPPYPTTVDPPLSPTLEASIAVKPSLLHIMKVVTTELILPNLPSFARPASKARCWPSEVLSPPHKSANGIRSLSMHQDDLKSLLSVGKAHGFTLQTMLHIALYSAIRLGATTDREDDDLPVSATTPVSLRSTAGGHPAATGNYVGVIESRDVVSTSTKLLNIGRKYAAQLASTQERLKAQHNVGMLAWIPDPPIADDAEWTGFENFIIKKRDKPVPFSASFEISNLGVMEVERGANIVWAQAASTIGAAIQLNVISVAEGSLNMTLTWKKNSLRDREIDNIWENFQRVLHRCTQPINDDVIIADLT